MRKMILAFICIIISYTLVACDFMNKPLRTKMINYYNDDSNYVALSGVIINIRYLEKSQDTILRIKILTEENAFPCDTETSETDFIVIDWSEKICNLNVNDTIDFVSAPSYFYEGHKLPIISIEKDGETLLSFGEGKEIYLNWINTTFE